MADTKAPANQASAEAEACNIEQAKQQHMEITAKARKLSSLASMLHYPVGIFSSLAFVSAGAVGVGAAKVGAGAAAIAVVSSPVVMGLFAAGAVLLAASVLLHYKASRINSSSGFDLCELEAKRTADHLVKGMTKVKEQEQAEALESKAPVRERSDGKSWSAASSKPAAAAGHGKA